MLREKISELIMQESACGFSRGIELFIESLETDLMKEEALTESENAVDNYLDALFEGVN